MLVPLSWLRDFAPFGADPADLAATLDDLGLVVEGIQRIGEGLDGVVVARVLATRPHPAADKVQLVDVDAGAGPRQVVCGAFNFAPGDLVPLASVGTTLPQGVTIGRRKVRGEWSEGMLCSSRELGVGDDAGGILVLPPGADPGSPVAEALGLAADVVFDLAVETNRPDALSVAGVARDLAARLGLPFTLPHPEVRPGGPRVDDLATVVVEAPDLCPRFTATVLVGVAVGPSPEWVARRLRLSGMRPINNVVDASNYVMLELGQPSHPYDLDLLAGRGLLVRRARPGDTLTTLDGVERRLGESAGGSRGKGDACLICDAEGTPVGIGGIMGGSSSEISAATSRVLLEAAYFDPMAIARSSRRLGLRTEASVRFERGCDPEGIERAVARFCQVLVSGQATGDQPGDGPVVAGGMIDVRGELSPRLPVVVRTSRINAILATELSDEQVVSYLTPLGFEVRPLEPGRSEVVVPTFRPDVEREIDVIEEVARHHGYSRPPRTLPEITQVGGLTPYQRDRRRVREILTGAGVTEAITSSLLAPDDMERAGRPGPDLAVANPLAREESRLRTSLVAGLLRAMVHNASHRNPSIRLFEIGHVFLPPEPGQPLPDERENLAVALSGDGDDGEGAAAAKRVWDTLAEGLRLEPEAVVLDAAAVEGLHPTRSARIRLESTGEVLGVVGEVDPAVLVAHGLGGRVGWIEADLDRLLSVPRCSAQAAPVSRFPSSDVDLAFVVDDSTPAAAVQRTLRQAGGELLEDLRLFDVYRDERLGPGRRSLTWRLRFCALDHTLTDDELAQARRRCIEAVEAAHPARLRG